MNRLLKDETPVKQIRARGHPYHPPGTRQGIHCQLKRFCIVLGVIGHGIVWRAYNVDSFAVLLAAALPFATVFHRTRLRRRESGGTGDKQSSDSSTSKHRDAEIP